MYQHNGLGTTIYGKAKLRQLEGAERVAAEQAGCTPHSYQSVKWFTILWMPIVPLGTFNVMKVHQNFWTTKAPQYRMERVEWDWPQVSRQFAVAWFCPALFVVWYLLVVGH